VAHLTTLSSQVIAGGNHFGDDDYQEYHTLMAITSDGMKLIFGYIVSGISIYCEARYSCLVEIIDGKRLGAG
jgi:hypothetical protein